MKSLNLFLKLNSHQKHQSKEHFFKKMYFTYDTQCPWTSSSPSPQGDIVCKLGQTWTQIPGTSTVLAASERLPSSMSITRVNWVLPMSEGGG